MDVLLVAPRRPPSLASLPRASLAEVVRRRPDVVLVDADDGVVRELVDAGLAVVVLVAPHEVARYLHTGARGFACRDGREAMAAAQAVATGGTYLAAALVEQLRASPPLRELTEREREVLRLVALGRSNREIAREMHVTAATVKTHVSHILTKLDLPNRMHAALLAQREGLRC
ncbi:response regulator transcription factor [Saccharothrix sp.]|uniref:response regulator transcription factor n=1 Tax=Saccharothrix sp. TaxID=1873460 RepID=UPI0028115415|nr:response regulator transcription factor [Saccharothrix sp.]